jgi:K+-sensing histidine kinase KdpD
VWGKEYMTDLNLTAQGSTVRPRDRRRHFVSYLVAAGFVVAATIARSLFDPWLGDSLPYITYFAAIVAAAWFGRLGPSLFAVVLSCATAEWFFIPARYSFKPSYETVGDWLGLVVFLFVGTLIAALSETLHRAQSLALSRREWLRVALKSIGDAVIATDAEGLVRLMNPIAEELTGCGGIRVARRRGGSGAGYF